MLRAAGGERRPDFRRHAGRAFLDLILRDFEIGPSSPSNRRA